MREWLAAGEPEVCVAVAAYQTAGRGRNDREWVSPPGGALLLSVGFRPTDLAAAHTWRLAAVVALAMRDAAEAVAGLADNTLWLKWPNDLVADAHDGALRKVAGVLGESVASGDRVESAVVGIGINTDWKMTDFPWAIAPTMTSLRELGGKRPIDNDAAARGLPRSPRAALRGAQRRASSTPAAGPPRSARPAAPSSSRSATSSVTGKGMGVDPETGALLVQPDFGPPVAVDSGEVIRCRVL